MIFLGTSWSWCPCRQVPCKGPVRYGLRGAYLRPLSETTLESGWSNASRESVRYKNHHVAYQERPRATNHYNTLGVETVHGAGEILIIDDVITRGASMMGAANRLADAFPDAKIRGFAITRTVSRSEEFRSIEDPQIGSIRLEANGETCRKP